MQGKRWPAAIISALLVGIVTYGTAAAATNTWQEGFVPALIWPAVVAAAGSLLSFLQPSTYEGARSEKE